MGSGKARLSAVPLKWPGIRALASEVSLAFSRPGFVRQLVADGFDKSGLSGMGSDRPYFPCGKDVKRDQHTNADAEKMRQVAPPSRRLSGGRPRPPRRKRDSVGAKTPAYPERSRSSGGAKYLPCIDSAREKRAESPKPRRGCWTSIQMIS